MFALLPLWTYSAENHCVRSQHAAAFGKGWSVLLKISGVRIDVGDRRVRRDEIDRVLSAASILENDGGESSRLAALAGELGQVNAQDRKPGRHRSIVHLEFERTGIAREQQERSSHGDGHAGVRCQRDRWCVKGWVHLLLEKKEKMTARTPM